MKLLECVSVLVLPGKYCYRVEIALKRKISNESRLSCHSVCNKRLNFFTVITLLMLLGANETMQNFQHSGHFLMGKISYLLVHNTEIRNCYQGQTALRCIQFSLDMYAFSICTFMNHSLQCIFSTKSIFLRLVHLYVPKVHRSSVNMKFIHFFFPRKYYSFSFQIMYVIL